MNQLMIAGVLIALSTWGLTAPAALADDTSPSPPLAAGTPAPDFATMTLDHKPLTLASLRGKVVLLDFWATWCPTCHLVVPTYNTLNHEFKGTDLRVIGLSVDDNTTIDRVRPFMKNARMNYTVSAWPDRNQDASETYHAGPFPSQYLIDKKGIVRWSQSDYTAGEGKKLRKLIQQLLAEKP